MIPEVKEQVTSHSTSFILQYYQKLEPPSVNHFTSSLSVAERPVTLLKDCWMWLLYFKWRHLGHTMGHVLVKFQYIVGKTRLEFACGEFGINSRDYP